MSPCMMRGAMQMSSSGPVMSPRSHLVSALRCLEHCVALRNVCCVVVHKKKKKISCESCLTQGFRESFTVSFMVHSASCADAKAAG